MSDIFWPIAVFLILVAAVIILILGIISQGRKTDAAEEIHNKVVRTQDLQNFLLLKIGDDLNSASVATRPIYIALRKIVDKANPDDDTLNDIAEAYKYRKGFKPEWIGE